MSFSDCSHGLTYCSNLNSAIITISVGPSNRLFAAHEDILSKSPYFAQACRAQFFEASGKRIDLPNEEPEVFSAVLEYLYKGDYSPKIAYDKKRASWFLDDDSAGMGENVVSVGSVGGPVLKDTVIYVCRLTTYQSIRDMLTIDSAPLTATIFPNCNASLLRNKAYSLACNAAPFCHLLASHTHTPLLPTASCEHTTLPSSSAAAALSSEAAPCRWRCSRAVRRYSSICSWRW